jgi:hypothetical protein
MWTPATRRQHSRKALRYQTDLTDDEWRLIEPSSSMRSQRTQRWLDRIRERDLRAGCAALAQATDHAGLTQANGEGPTFRAHRIPVSCGPLIPW